MPNDSIVPEGADRRHCRRPGGVRACLALAAVLPVAGCSPLGAPTISLFGAYFPSWLASALVGILGAVLVRLVFIRAGIDDAIPARLPVYVCIAFGIGFLFSHLGFGR